MKSKLITTKTTSNRNAMRAFSAAITTCAALLFTHHIKAEDKAATTITDANFIRHEVSAGLANAKLAQLGVKRAENLEVKALAEAVFIKHTKTGEEMSKFASMRKVEMDTEIETGNSKSLKKLEATSGSDFDKAFISELIRTQEQSLGSYEELSKETKDGELKAEVDRMIREVKADLSQSKQLNSRAFTSAADQPTNTSTNKRDRDDKTMTPLDQGGGKSDIAITAQIRKAIIANETMSVNAQNVKIITLNGKVTLRGPVNSAEEKRIIGEISSDFVNSDHVNNQLDLKPDGESK